MKQVVQKRMQETLKHQMKGCFLKQSMKLEITTMLKIHGNFKILKLPRIMQIDLLIAHRFYFTNICINEVMYDVSV